MDRALLERMVGAVVLVLLLVVVAPALLDGRRGDEAGEAPETLPERAPATTNKRIETIILDPSQRSAERSSSNKPDAQPAVVNPPIDGVAEVADTDEEPAQMARMRVESPVEETPAPAPDPKPVVRSAPPKPAVSDRQPEVVVKKVTPPPPAKPTVVDPPVVARAEPAAKAPVAARPQQASPGGNFAVQVGSFSERQNAHQFAGRLKSDGFSGVIATGESASGVVYRVYAGPRPSREAADKLAAVLASKGYSGMVVDMERVRAGGR